MSETDWKKFDKQFDRVVKQTAASILKALGKMQDDAPEIGGVPADLIECVVRELVVQADPYQAWMLERIMEDHDVREAYYSTLARRPVTARKRV